MLNQQVNLAQTTLHLSRLYFRMRREERDGRRRLQQMLATLSTAAPSPDTFEKMFRYWQLAHYAVCGALAGLQGRQLTEAEEKRLLLLSVISPLYDEMFEARNAEVTLIRQLTRTPQEYIPQHEGEALLKAAYLRLLDCTLDPDKVVAHFNDVCYWQEVSRRQQSAGIGEAELFRITYHKSYHAVLLCYTAFDRYPSPSETAMAFPMAGLVQLTNDVFDIWKDIRSGIFTIPILYRRYGRLERRFSAESARFNQALARLQYPAARRKQYALTIHTLHAMGALALRNLRQESRGVQNVTELALLGRKRLVYDLDGMARKWALVKKTCELANLTHSDGPVEVALKREAAAAAYSRS